MIHISATEFCNHRITGRKLINNRRRCSCKAKNCLGAAHCNIYRDQTSNWLISHQKRRLALPTGKMSSLFQSIYRQMPLQPALISLLRASQLKLVGKTFGLSLAITEDKICYHRSDYSFFLKKDISCAQLIRRLTRCKWINYYITLPNDHDSSLGTRSIRFKNQTSQMVLLDGI